MISDNFCLKNPYKNHPKSEGGSKNENLIRNWHKNGTKRNFVFGSDVQNKLKINININIIEYFDNLYIYIIKVLSIHWSKSRPIFVAHVSSKVMSDTPSTKFLSVCMYVSVVSEQKLLTIHVKTAEGIIMKFHIWIRWVLTYVYCYITFWYFDPKSGFGGAH